MLRSRETARRGPTLPRGVGGGGGAWLEPPRIGHAKCGLTALMAVVLALATQTSAEATDQAGRTMLYVGAPTVGVPDARRAGAVGRAAAEGASSRTLVALGFPPEVAREHAVERALVSLTEPTPEDAEGGVTAEAAREAGTLYLAQTGREPSTDPDTAGGGELAGSSPVRPELGDGEVAVVGEDPQESGPEAPSAAPADDPVSTEDADVPAGMPVSATEEATVEDPLAEDPHSPQAEPPVPRPYEMVSSHDRGDAAPESEASPETGPISTEEEQVPTTLAEGEAEQPPAEESTAGEDGFEPTHTSEIGDAGGPAPEALVTTVDRRPQAYPAPPPTDAAEDAGDEPGATFPPPGEEQPPAGDEAQADEGQGSYDEYAVPSDLAHGKPPADEVPTQYDATGDGNSYAVVSVEQSQSAAREATGGVPQDNGAGGAPVADDHTDAAVIIGDATEPGDEMLAAPSEGRSIEPAPAAKAPRERVAVGRPVPEEQRDERPRDRDAEEASARRDEPEVDPGVRAAKPQADPPRPTSPSDEELPPDGGASVCVEQPGGCDSHGPPETADPTDVAGTSGGRQPKTGKSGAPEQKESGPAVEDPATDRTTTLTAARRPKTPAGTEERAEKRRSRQEHPSDRRVAVEQGLASQQRREALATVRGAAPGRAAGKPGRLVPPTSPEPTPPSANEVLSTRPEARSTASRGATVPPPRSSQRANQDHEGKGH